MAAPDLLTIAEAAAALNVSEQRVHQLLDAGELDGPELPPGRMRFPPGAGRITEASVQRLWAARADKHAAREERRQRRRQALQTTARAERGSQKPPLSDARAAAHELKVKMDVLRDQLREERARNRQLLDVSGRLIDLLKQSSDSADELDEVTDGYSQALTQLLSPDSLTPD